MAGATALLSLAILFVNTPPAGPAENSVSRIQQRTDRLEAGVQAEESIRAVKRLQNTCSHYLASGLWADLADLFADNAVGQFSAETITGKANLGRHFMEQAGRTSSGLAKGQLNLHLVLQPIVTLGADGKTAKGTWDQMADTFANNGSKEITGAGVYVGRERIRKVLNLRGPRDGRTPDFFTIHQLTQPVIHISEDGNSAKARLRLFQCGSWIGGIYANTAVKENGEWKFGVQDLHHIFNASYRNGWARVGAAARVKSQPGLPQTGRDVPGGGIQQGLGGAATPSRFAAEFPPDRPIRSKQYAFPQIGEPAFHYKNPVTGRMPPQLLP